MRCLLAVAHGRHDRQGLGAIEVLRRCHQGYLELRGFGSLVGVEAGSALQHRAQASELGSELQVALGAQRERRSGRVGAERDRPGDAFDQHQRQGVDVGASVETSSQGLFGRGVASGTHGCAGRLGPRRLGERPGQTEVGQPQSPVLVEEQVGGLHVAMDESPLVGVCERAGGVEADDQGLRGTEGHSAVQDPAQAATAQVLGDQVGHDDTVDTVLTPVEHRHDARMAEGASGTGLGAEAAQERLVLCERLVEELHRHTPAELRVHCQVHPRGGADADRGYEPVATTEHTPGLL